MKKKLSLRAFAILTLLTALLLTAGCSQPASGAAPADWGIELEAREVTPQSMVLHISRHQGNVKDSVLYGNPFHIQQSIDGNWSDLEPVNSDAFTWTTEAHSLTLDGNQTISLNWGNIYGTLPPGQYRLSKTFSQASGGDAVTLFAEFEIT